MRVDVAVVGGGAVGISVAWMLQESGVPGVALLEQRGLGSGATGHGAGLVSCFCREPLDAELVRRSASLYEEAGRLTSPVFRRTGLYVLATRSATAAALRRRAGMLRDLRIEVEDIEPGRGRARLPALDWAGVEAACYLPDDGVVDPGAYARQVGRLLRERGIKVLEGTRARRLAVSRGRVEGVEAEGDAARVAADVVVLATGVWTRLLLRASAPPGAARGAAAGEPELDVPIKPYRTQLSFWRLPEGLHLPPVWDVDGEVYWLERDGLLAVGNGTEEREADPLAFRGEPDDAFVAWARQRLLRRCPAASAAEFVRGWAHLCDATPDRRPLLGPYGAEGLYLAVGFNGFGVMRAPAVGEAVAALVLGGRPPVDVSPYRADRFAGFVDFPIRQGWTVEAPDGRAETSHAQADVPRGSAGAPGGASGGTGREGGTPGCRVP